MRTSEEHALRAEVASLRKTNAILNRREQVAASAARHALRVLGEMLEPFKAGKMPYHSGFGRNLKRWVQWQAAEEVAALTAALERIEAKGGEWERQTAREALAELESLRRAKVRPWEQ